jgi:hypothetical protein
MFLSVASTRNAHDVFERALQLLAVLYDIFLEGWLFVWLLDRPKDGTLMCAPNKRREWYKNKIK